MSVSEKRLLRTNWLADAARLRLSIDSGSIQSFYLDRRNGRKLLIACGNDETLLTYSVYSTAGGTGYLNGAPCYAYDTVSKSHTLYSNTRLG